MPIKNKVLIIISFNLSKKEGLSYFTAFLRQIPSTCMFQKYKLVDIVRDNKSKLEMKQSLFLINLKRIIFFKFINAENGSNHFVFPVHFFKEKLKKRIYNLSRIFSKYVVAFFRTIQKLD